MTLLAQSSNSPGVNWEGTGELLRAEAAAVWRLQKAGVVRNIWFTHPGRDAVIIMECGSVDEARAFLAGLPLVKARLIQFDVVALVPYDGFERLWPA
jgi:hypothetical protein